MRQSCFPFISGKATKPIGQQTSGSCPSLKLHLERKHSYRLGLSLPQGEWALPLEAGPSARGPGQACRVRRDPQPEMGAAGSHEEAGRQRL